MLRFNKDTQVFFLRKNQNANIFHFYENLLPQQYKTVFHNVPCLMCLFLKFLDS